MAAECAEPECLLRMFDNGNPSSFFFVERLQFQKMIKNGTMSVHLGKYQRLMEIIQRWSGGSVRECVENWSRDKIGRIAYVGPRARYFRWWLRCVSKLHRNADKRQSLGSRAIPCRN